MKTHTSEFKNNIKVMGREIDSKFTFTYNGEEVNINDESLMSVSPHYEGAILKSIMKELDIECKEELQIGTIVNYQFGIKTRNDEVEDYRDNYDYINFGNYIVNKVEKKEDTNTYQIKCYDNMIKSMVNYENINLTFPLTIRGYINELCTFLGLSFRNAGDSFANYDKTLLIDPFLDNEGNSLGYTFRDIFDQLAQVTGSVICINEDSDELEVRYPVITSDTINEEFIKDINVKFGELYNINTLVLSRSADTDKIYLSYPEDLPEENRKTFEIKDNEILNGNDRDTYMSAILNKLLDIEYYINDYSSTGICYYNVYDKYNISIGEENYSCLMLNDDISVKSGLSEIISAEMPKEAEIDYTKSDTTDRRINQTYLIVDKQNQTIESVVTNVTAQDNKISQISQTVDEINSKISDVIDITTTAEDTDAQVEMENINESEPIQIKIRPIGTNISYLYPHSNLYPSSTLYPSSRTIQFIRTYIEDGETKTQNIYYELPDDLLYYDSNHYDEFYLDYDSQTCEIRKQCEYNADGTVSVLANERVDSYTYPTINLGSGDYEIKLLGYSTGYLFVRLMTQNIYTTQFYTKAEVDSHINQKATEIELGVGQTLTNYSTTSQMNSAINVKANEITSSVSETYATKATTNTLSSRISQTAKGISLTVNNGSTSSGITIGVTKEDGTTTTTSGTIQMNGLVKFTDLSGSGTTTINGSNITTGTISANRVSGGTLQGTTIIANSGTIGGYTMASDRLYSGNVGISGDNGVMSFWAGSSNPANAPFRVGPDGSMVATNASISGNVDATDGTFRGTVYASSGRIGGWNLSSNRLYGTSDGNQYSIRPYGVANDTTGIEQSWSRIMSAVSDKRLKHDIIEIDNKYEQFYNNLKPVSFYYNDKISDDKKHFGFIAQDIVENEKKLNEELSMVELSGKYYNLYKEEIIALNTWQIQKQKKEIELLKEEIETLKGIIKNGNMQENQKD